MSIKTVVGQNDEVKIITEKGELIMAMKTVKRDIRGSKTRITITSNAIVFSAGWFRKYNLNINNTRFIKLGYDDQSNEIGIDFRESINLNTDLLKLTYNRNGHSASCGIKSLLASFCLDKQDIVGVYENDAIIGPVEIDYFSDHCFLLKINNRKQNDRPIPATVIIGGE